MTSLLLLSDALASGGGVAEAPMIPLLWGLFLVGFVYLTAHFVVERLQKRYLFSSGVEYIALGVGLSYLAVFHNRETYIPAITFAVGWIGLLFGLKLSLGTLLKNGAALRLALTEFVFVGLGLGGAFSVLLYFFVEPDLSSCVICGGILGATALATSTSAIDVVRQRFPTVESHVITLLHQGTQINNVLAILFFGVLLCTYRREHILGELYQNVQLKGGMLIALVTIAFGFLLSKLYSVFLIENDSDNSRFLAIAGFVCFAAGAAVYVELPVLLLMMFMGLGFAKKHKKGIIEMMKTSRKPIVLILLIFAGVQLEPVSWGTASWMFLGFLVLRFLCKALSGWLSSYGSTIRGDIFRGNLAQGEISLAIACSFQLIEGPAAQMAYVLAISSVAFYELFSARWLRGLLIDIGEIREDISIIREG